MFSYLASTNITSLNPAVNLNSFVQRLVLQGYKYCQRRTYFVTFKNIKAKVLIKTLSALYLKIDKDYTERWHDKAGCCESKFASMDIAFTSAGLKKLGVKQELRDIFRLKNPAFHDNAFVRAQTQLGDTGWSDPLGWEQHYRDFDMVLVTHVAVDDIVDETSGKITQLNTLKRSDTLSSLHVDIQKWLDDNTCTANHEDACPLDFAGTVHFGMKDGITSPHYIDQATTLAPSDYKDEHALGDVLLGHKRRDGSNPYANVDSNLHSYAASQLGALTDGKDSRAQKALAFFKNSSFGVLRKMQQREDVLNEWLEAEAMRIALPDAQLTGVASDPKDPYRHTKDRIKAKMLGRKPQTGEILSPHLAPSTPNSPPAEKGFQDADAQGLGCPFASHIRRMNPRDDLVVPFIARPLLRRGMPYGAIDGSDKGLAGIFICADIEEQFEHLVGKWANGSVFGVNDQSDCLDPLIGNHQRKNSRLFINAKQGDDTKNYVTGFKQPFVVTRGCAYVWFPSVDTLKILGDYIQS